MDRQDLRFLVQDYLTSLRERNELDAILPDLLRAMGMRIVKLAFRGEVEHGVDVAAVKKENHETILYLFVIKAGDIDTAMWDSGPNAVRPTLNNLLDVPFQDLSQPELRTAKRKTILVHNGVLRSNVLAKINGYIEDTFSPRMAFDRWGLDTLATHFHDYLLSERLFPKQQQRLLKRALVFVDVPDYDLSDLRELISETLPDVKQLTKPQRSKVFGAVRLILAMIRSECQREGFNNLSPAVSAHEYTLLSLWGWMYRNGLFNKAVLKEFILSYLQYLEVLTAWTERVACAATVPDGLAFGGTFEQVEYPLRTFSVIGNLGLLCTCLVFLPDSDVRRERLQRSVGLLVEVIRHNLSRHRPMLDNHSIDIFLGMFALLTSSNAGLARQWLEDILKHLAIRKQLFHRLPELNNNVDAVIEYEATGERPIGYTDSSSTLIYMLFELCLLFDAEELYIECREVFKDISMQLWYPPEDVEEVLYRQEVLTGDTEIIHELPTSFENFRLDVQARHQFDRMDYSPFIAKLPVLLLIANKHFRTPVFPFWWRSLIFRETAKDEADCGSPNGKEKS